MAADKIAIQKLIFKVKSLPITITRLYFNSNFVWYKNKNLLLNKT